MVVRSWLLLALLVISGCGGEQTRRSIPAEPAQVDFAEVFAWTDAGLYFLQLDGHGSMWNLDPESLDVQAVTPQLGSRKGHFVALQASEDQSDLFAWRLDLDTEAGRVESMVAEDVNVVSGASFECLESHPGVPNGISMVERHTLVDQGSASRVRAIEPGDLGELEAIGLSESRVFCPVFWNDDLPSYAWSEQVDRDNGFEARLIIERGGETIVLERTGCTLMPVDVAEDGSLMAVAVGCDDPSESGLFLLPLDAPRESQLRLVRSGTIGAAAFAPGDGLIAYTRARQSDGDDEPVVEVLNLDADEYLEVPSSNSAWPAWLQAGAVGDTTR